MRDFGDAQAYTFLLSRIGTASGLKNNNSVALSGVWSKKPVVAVGFSDIATYSPTQAADQEISAAVMGTDYAGAGVYNVRAAARLIASGGVFTWNLQQKIPADRLWYVWSYHITPPSMEYAFDWFYAGQPIIKSVTFGLSGYSSRNCNDVAPGYKYTPLASIYIDYVNSSGATISKYLEQVSIGTEQWSLYRAKVDIGGVASQVRIRAVMSNGPLRPYGTSAIGGDSVETVTFSGGAVYKSDAEVVTIYEGTLNALAVGR